MAKIHDKPRSRVSKTANFNAVTPRVVNTDDRLPLEPPPAFSDSYEAQGWKKIVTLLDTVGKNKTSKYLHVEMYCNMYKVQREIMDSIQEKTKALKDYPVTDCDEIERKHSLSIIRQLNADRQTLARVNEQLLKLLKILEIQTVIVDKKDDDEEEIELDEFFD